MKKSVLVDFYNLHLKSEWIVEKPRKTDLPPDFVPKTLDELLEMPEYQVQSRKLIPPDEKEQQRIIEFFKIHVPNVVKPLTEKEKQKVREFSERFNNWCKEQPETKKLTQELQTHMKELIDRNTLDGYQEETGTPWFLGDEFGAFVVKHRHIKSLIDGYLDGYIAVDSLIQLEKWMNNHHLITFIYKKDLSEIHLPEMLARENKLQMSLDEYFLRWSLKEKSGIGKITLGDLFHQICTEMKMVLMGGMEIKRCAAGATSKTPACQNIFIPQRENAEYCSKRCYSRIYQATKVYPKIKANLAGVHKRGRKKSS